jgi:hypothetical protein
LKLCPTIDSLYGKEWFTANKLTLNLEKTNTIQLKKINTPQYDLSVGYNEKNLKESVNTKCLGLQIDNHLNWKNHIDQMVPKLSGACYAIRSMFLVSNTDTLKSVYFAYFDSIIKYGIIFWGNSSSSKNIFTLQRKVVRIMAGVKPRISYRTLFKRLEFLPLPFEYIFPLTNFIVNNQKLFQANSTVHSVNTRNKHQLHRPIANLSGFQKSAFYAGIKIFNSLPTSLTNLMNKKQH